MNLKKLITPGIVLGSLLTLSGCDTERDIKVYEMNINNNAKVEIIKNINFWAFDTYTLNIYDSCGGLRTSFYGLSLGRRDLFFEDSGMVSGIDPVFQQK